VGLLLAGSAITLLAQRGLPVLGLALYGQAFRASYGECRDANARAAKLNNLPLDTEVANRLRKSEEIDRLSCIDSHVLHDRLQQFGLNTVDLDLIETRSVGPYQRTNPRAYYFASSYRVSLDQKLRTAVIQYGLRPISIRRYEADPRWKLGQALFFDPVLSGNRDVACATCHLLQYGLSDGLPRSVGTNGEGLGAERKLLRGTQVHPRHSLDLWNRDNNAVRSFFWDGHVEVLDPQKHLFRSPLGESLPTGFQNAMAVQSIFPITVSDEMLGYYGEHSSSALPYPHANRPNELVISASYPSKVAQIRSVHHQIIQRLLAISSVPDPWQQKYRVMFHEAFPQKRLEELSIVELGNALSHFEELAFASSDSAWDRYVGGELGAISDQAKIGAIVFFGKGRCAACHSGPLFSDFEYHGVGIFSKIYLDGKYVSDLGRGSVTGNPDDDYHFRTPPLRNVTKFGPYFHDGSTTSLGAAVVRHLHPLAKSGSYNPDGTFAISREQANSISPILADGIDFTQDDVGAILAFLATLEAQTRSREQIVPTSVPSGIPISY
jgi:cytochrome c peroxidase